MSISLQPRRRATRRTWVQTCALAVTAVSLMGCSLATPQPSAPQIPVQAQAKPAAIMPGPELTYTVKRGTLANTITVPGKVIPARAMQLDFKSNGTVSAVHVGSGQTVKAGTPLVEMTLDQGALQSAADQATLADLALAAQQAKVDELKQGAASDTIESARAEVARAQAALQQALYSQSAVAQGSASTTEQPADTQPAPNSQQFQFPDAATQTSIDRDVTLAQLDLRLARDAHASALAGVTRAEANVAAAQRRVTEYQSYFQSGLDAARARADADERAAQRTVDQAELSLQQAQKKPQETAVKHQITQQERRMQDVQDALDLAKTNAERALGMRGTNDLPAAQIELNIRSAENSVTSATRQIEEQQIALDDLMTSLEAAREADAIGVQRAQITLDQARDDLVQAHAFREKLANATVLPSASPGDLAYNPSVLLAEAQDALAAATAQVSAVQRQVDLSQYRLDAVLAAQAYFNAGTDTRNQVAAADVTARQAALGAAQAKLSRLLNGPAADNLKRESQRLELLQAQADAAHEAVSGIAILRAPFDGMVAAVNVGVGQSVQSQFAAVQIAGYGSLEVSANADETDVNLLSVNQQVDVSFSGLPSVTVPGTVIDVSGIAVPTEASSEAAFPVRVQLDSSTPPTVKLGMTASVNIDQQRAENILYVPTSALRTVDGKTLVTTIDPTGQVSDRTVRVGGTFGDNVEVVSGVNEGDVVALQTSPTGLTARLGT